MADQTPKKISDLPEIKAKDISADDLLLVTDVDGGSKTSRKMTMKQLADYVINRLSANPAPLKNVIENTAADVFDSKIVDGVINTVRDNHDVVEDVLDGVQNDQFLIDAGNANAQEG